MLWLGKTERDFTLFNFEMSANEEIKISPGSSSEIIALLKMLLTQCLLFL